MSKISSNFIKYSFIILCLIFLFILGADLYLSFNKLSLCPTQGCKIANTYVIGGGKVFPLMGLIFSFVILNLFLIYCLKERPYILEYFLWCILLCGLSFDGVLIGYLIKMKVFCILCLGVAFFLILLTILFSIFTQRYYAILIGIFLWGSSILGINLLKINSISSGPPDISKGVVIHVPSKKTENIKADLFVSLHCFHCFDVIFNLAKAMPYEKIKWNIHFLDMSHKDMLKIAHMLKDKDIKNNPFGVILKYERKSSLDEIQIPDFVKTRIKNSRTYFRYMGFKGVPLLIMSTPNVKFIVVGDKSIGRFLLKQGIVDKWYVLRLVR